MVLPGGNVAFGNSKPSVLKEKVHEVFVQIGAHLKSPSRCTWVAAPGLTTSTQQLDGGQLLCFLAVLPTALGPPVALNG